VHMVDMDMDINIHEGFVKNNMKKVHIKLVYNTIKLIGTNKPLFKHIQH